MSESYWTRVHPTRRRFLRGIGRVTSALTLAPAIAACGGATHSGSGSPASNQSGGKPVKGGTLTLRTFADVSNLDYAFATDAYSEVIIINCVEPLLTVDTKGQPIRLLAASWENPDDRTYVFKLRQSVKFQDGTDFNADAVAYSLNRIHADKTSFRYPELLYLDKIERPDQGTIKLTLSGPYAPFLYNLAGDAGRVVSPAIAEKYGKDKLKRDLTGQGTGPLKFVEWKTDDHITLVRNENYWGRDDSGTQLPYVDKLIFRVIPDATSALAALRNGEVDAFAPLSSSPPAKDVAGVKADASLSYRETPGPNFNYLLFNEAKEPFSSKELRQAVSYAVDRTAIAKNVFFDTVLPFDAIFNPSIWAYDAEYHPYLKRDIGKAKQLLAQAGKPNGFPFTYLTRTGSASLQQMAELIKDQLKEAGMDMTIEQVEFPKLLDAARTGAYQVANMNYPAGLDPDSWMYPPFSTKGGQNGRSHYSNAQVDRLLEEARTVLDVSHRKPLYQQAQRIVMGDAAVCVLYNSPDTALTLRKVHDFPPGPYPAVGLSQVWKSG